MCVIVLRGTLLADGRNSEDKRKKLLFLLLLYMRVCGFASRSGISPLAR